MIEKVMQSENREELRTRLKQRHQQIAELEEKTGVTRTNNPKILLTSGKN